MVFCCILFSAWVNGYIFCLFRDGIPPYRIRKQHRREMQESVQVNGRVPLPHIPVSPTYSAAPYLLSRCLTGFLHRVGHHDTNQWEKYSVGFLGPQLTTGHSRQSVWVMLSWEITIRVDSLWWLPKLEMLLLLSNRKRPPVNTYPSLYGFPVKSDVLL